MTAASAEGFEIGCHAVRAATRRVLFLIPSLAGGGSERVALALLHYLERERFDLHLCVVDSSGPFLSQLPIDVPLHDLKSRRVRYSLLTLLRLIWKLRPHTILSTVSHMNLALLALRPLLPAGIRLCIRESTMLSAAFQRDNRSPVWTHIHRRLYRTADVVICQSDRMLDDLSQRFGIPLQKLVRIYNPIDIASLAKMAEGESPFPNNCPQLVAAGRLEPAKGFNVLLTAMALVREHVPDVRLTILGEGTLRETLRAQSSALGLLNTVTFAGFVHNPYRYYAHSDLFVLSSHYEGLPNAMLEAMALGVPVVATDCPGGVREVLEHSDVHRLVPAGQPSELAAGILAALMQRQKINITEQRRLHKMVNIDDVIRDYATLLLK